MRHVLVLIVAIVAPSIALAAPAAKLWPYWQAYDGSATARVDHTAWGKFLERYLEPAPDGVNRLAYGAVSAGDRRLLDRYIEMLAALPVRQLTRPEHMAYWINLYNALTVQVVLDHYPVDSIRDIDISPGLFSDGPWGRKLVAIEGQEVSLDDIEHRILRPIWRDPRVHYAVNCASIGCPNLQPEPFTADHLEQQLEAAARAYVNHPRGVSITGDRLVVASIYDWFEEDFGGSERGVIEHLARFAAPALKQRLSRFESIDGDRYDWRLNDAARPS